MHAKRYIDYANVHFEKQCLNEKKKISKFYNRIINKKKFDKVDKLCFVKFFNKLLRKKSKRKFKAVMLINDDLDFVLFVSFSFKKRSNDAITY